MESRCRENDQHPQNVLSFYKRPCVEPQMGNAF